MIQGKIWFRCAAVHDPISPVIVKPAVIGWEAKYRKIDLVIERALKGEELLKRMKGWITVDPQNVIDTVEKFGRLKLIDDTELIVETESLNDFKRLQKEFRHTFGDEVDLELIQKS